MKGRRMDAGIWGLPPLPPPPPPPNTVVWHSDLPGSLKFIGDVTAQDYGRHCMLYLIIYLDFVVSK